jgi:hypothetical protein
VEYYLIESNFMILFHRLFIVFFWIGYCLVGFHFSDIRCLNGPDFWCLNDTTEFVCNFTNKIIGICGYSSERCQVQTGKKKEDFFFKFFFQ